MEYFWLKVTVHKFKVQVVPKRTKQSGISMLNELVPEKLLLTPRRRGVENDETLIKAEAITMSSAGDSLDRSRKCRTLLIPALGIINKYKRDDGTRFKFIYFITELDHWAKRGNVRFDVEINGLTTTSLDPIDLDVLVLPHFEFPTTNAIFPPAVIVTPHTNTHSVSCMV